MIYLSSSSATFNFLFCSWSCHCISHADMWPQFSKFTVPVLLPTTLPYQPWLPAPKQPATRIVPSSAVLSVPCSRAHPRSPFPAPGPSGSLSGLVRSPWNVPSCVWPLASSIHHHQTFTNLLSPQCLLRVAFKVLSSLLFTLISFSPSLSILFSFHRIDEEPRREGWCSGIATPWEKTTFILYQLCQ